MKKVGCIFTVVGTVVGAGFLSGRELVRFFGTESFLPFVLLSSLIFAFFIYFLLSLGSEYGGFAGVIRLFPPKAVRIFRFFLLFACFVSLSGMFAGIYSLFHSVAVVLVTLVAAFFVCRGGIKALGAVNTLFVPSVLVFFLFVFVGNGYFSYGGSASGIRAYAALLYAGMNLFLAVPVLCDLGGEMNGGRGLCAGITALLLFAFISLILSAVRFCDGAEAEDFPLLFVMKDYIFYRVVAVFGTFTSLVSSYYPLFSAAQGKKYANPARIGVLFAAFALSFFGFSNIVEYGYPFLGSFGLIFLIVGALYYRLFKKGDEGVHSRRHHAKQRHRSHDEI